MNSGLNLTPLQHDTLMVTDVAGRVERALAERWHIEGDGLREQIDALRKRRVERDVIDALHYLRMQRNRVIHHPRQTLDDAEKFAEYAAHVLPLIEGSDSAEEFHASLTERLGSVMQRMTQSLEADVLKYLESDKY
jgi:hypothetical protein